MDGRVLSSRYSGTFSPVPPGKLPGGAAPIARWLAEYEYEIGGVTYRGNAQTRQMASRAGIVRVYYDVDDPSRSVLDPGVDAFRFATAVAYACFFLLVRLFAIWRQPPPSKST